MVGGTGQGQGPGQEGAGWGRCPVGSTPGALIRCVAPPQPLTVVAPPAACHLPSPPALLLSARHPQVLEFVGADAQSYVHRPLPPAMQVGVGLGFGMGLGLTTRCGVRCRGVLRAGHA